MGLFDFIGDIGKKIFSKEEEASAAVTQHINEDNPGVADVAVKVENGVAKISGVASSAGALEKALKQESWLEICGAKFYNKKM